MARLTRAAARATLASGSPQQLSSPPATPVPLKKRSRRAVKLEEQDDDQLPHNLGTALPSPGSEKKNTVRPRKRAKREVKSESPDIKIEQAVVSVKGESPKHADTPKKTPKKANYGFNPGVTPYPDYLRPTSEECHEVTRLLEKAHGKVNVPKSIPAPSLTVAGCGEVPSVLDALVRTRLSANTTNKNSSTAFQGLVKRFGTIKEGVGKGSVDWNAVRIAPQKEVYKAIERGGLADRKSKDIQMILQMAWEENQERGAALASPDRHDPSGAENASDPEKQGEIEKASSDIVSLDHMHLLRTDDAIRKMIEYPGIGLKTAACVAMFCMQRPVFAVDTHVYRLCQYLGWVPKTAKKGQPRVDRDPTFLHCDARIPDELKYPLHVLLIKHGKLCPRCRAITGQSSAGWEEGCPIEHLVKRHGAKKGGISVADRKRAEKAAINMEASDVVDTAPEQLNQADGSGDEEG